MGSPGVLNGATAGSEDSQLEIAYDRFLHFDAQTVIQVRFKSVPGSDGKTRVWLSRAHMQQFVLDQVMPPADSSEVTPDRMVFVFQSPRKTGNPPFCSPFGPKRRAACPAKSASWAATPWRFHSLCTLR